MAKLAIGQPAPSFQLPDLDDGMVRLEDFHGRVVLINFWSAECPWVERADAVLAEFQDRITLLNMAANPEETPEMFSEAAAERGLRIILLDRQQEVARLYGAQTTPHYFLIDREGILRYQGAFDDVTFRQRIPLRSYLVEAIEALLAGEYIPITETTPYGCAISLLHEQGDL